MPYCITCGWEHELRDPCPVTEQMRELFRAGKYRMPVPPVQTAYWREDDWIVWIDCHGQWEE
jgi:hypothetical protein